MERRKNLRTPCHHPNNDATGLYCTDRDGEESLCAKAYIAQFYPAQEFLSTKIEVTAGEEIFTASGKVILQDGWSVLYQKEQHDTEDDTDQAQHLPSVRKGDFVSCQDGHIKEGVTKPPVRFTPATLLKAMKEIHKYVKDRRLKETLKEC